MTVRRAWLVRFGWCMVNSRMPVVYKIYRNAVRIGTRWGKYLAVSFVAVDGRTEKVMVTVCMGRYFLLSRVPLLS